MKDNSDTRCKDQEHSYMDNTASLVSVNILEPAPACVDAYCNVSVRQSP